MCPMTPSPSSPLTKRPARYPAIAPRTIHAMMLIPFLRPHRGPLTRLLGLTVPCSGLVSNVVAMGPQRDYARLPGRNNGMSSMAALGRCRMADAMYLRGDIAVRTGPRYGAESMLLMWVPSHPSKGDHIDASPAHIGRSPARDPPR